jgi:hypothetical protein
MNHEDISQAFRREFKLINEFDQLKSYRSLAFLLHSAVFPASLLQREDRRGSFAKKWITLAKVDGCSWL